MMQLSLEEKIKEVISLYNENHSVNKAIEIVKGYSLTDQSIENNHNRTKEFNDIIAPNENIDNGQIYADETGEVKRDLI